MGEASTPQVREHFDAFTQSLTLAFEAVGLNPAGPGRWSGHPDKSTRTKIEPTCQATNLELFG